MILNRLSLIKLWFIVDAILALIPPIYWWVNKQSFFWGLPANLGYFLFVSVFITASVVVAYWLDNEGKA